MPNTKIAVPRRDDAEAEREFRRFAMDKSQPLRGRATKRGELWHFTGDGDAEVVSFELFANGFQFYPDCRPVPVVLTPFTLVRNCKLQGGTAGLPMSSFKVFKIACFTEGTSYYFGVRIEDDLDAEADLKRSKWVVELSHIISTVNQSLFPQFSMQCLPVDGVPSTTTRLLAGYLGFADHCDVLAVVYAELHAHGRLGARFVLYENPFCTRKVSELLITQLSTCCEMIGINCTCFSVEGRHFSCRSPQERKIWLRAISNIKVKLHHRAPLPSEQDLADYRLSVCECIKVLETSCVLPIMDPLLPRLQCLAAAARAVERADDPLDVPDIDIDLDDPD